MANRINNPPPRTPLWPWGGPRSVRERLVDPAEFERKKRVKKGDPKNPALASTELLDFIGPAHSADELRLPLPPMPEGHDADLDGFNDRPALESVVGRLETSGDTLQRSLASVSAAPERLERLKSLLSREEQMLGLAQRVNSDLREIHQKMQEEQKERGY